MLFFLILLLIRFGSYDDDESSDGSDDGGSGSDFASDSCELGSDRVGTSIVSDRVGTSSIFSPSSILFSVHLFESYLVKSRVL